MTIVVPSRPNGPNGYDPAATGCTSCGSQRTVTLCSTYGRRCADCPPTFNREWADALVDMGMAGEAFRYLRAWLAYRAWTA